jgi:hypothetical protein
VFCGFSHLLLRRLKISGVFSAETRISFPVCCALGKHAHCSLCCSALMSFAKESGTVRYGARSARGRDSGGSSRSGCAGTVQVHANDRRPWPLARCSCSAHRHSSVPLFLAPVSSILLGAATPHPTRQLRTSPSPSAGFFVHRGYLVKHRSPT